jgi:O-antigen/teichoic acid export membrane protein
MAVNQPVRRRKNLAQRLLSGAAWALGAKVLGVGSALIVNALLARMLSPDEMGAYFLTVSIVMFAGIVASFGLRQTVVRLVAESLAQGLPGRARKTISIVFGIAATGALVVGGGYLAFMGEWLSGQVFEMPRIANAVGITAIWISILAIQTPLAEVFRGLHDIRLAVFLDGILASILLALITAGFAFAGIDLDYESAVLLSMIAALISLSCGGVLFLRRRSLLHGGGEIALSAVLKISAPLFITNIANYSINQFSLWVVAANLPADDVAIYGAAWRLVNLIALPIMLMNMTVNPVIAELHAVRERSTLQNALRGTATLAAIPAFVVLATYMLFGDEILLLVFGDGYGEGGGILLALSIGMLANVWTGSCGQVLALTGRQRELMIITLATGFVSVAIAMVGVRYAGLIGVAFAVALGRVVQNAAAWWLVHRLTGLWTHGTLRPSFLKLAWVRVREKSNGVATEEHDD